MAFTDNVGFHWKPPSLTHGEIMDQLFDLWIHDGSNKTFEEFICPGNGPVS